MSVETTAFEDPLPCSLADDEDCADDCELLRAVLLIFENIEVLSSVALLLYTLGITKVSSAIYTVKAIKAAEKHTAHRCFFMLRSLPF